jgi:GDP-mannose 6-dehydrogenase
MKANIFGLGYVGCVSAACLAESGHEVTGIDVDRSKIDLINGGNSPIIEPGLEDLVKKAVGANRLRASTCPSGEADVSIICVGTPSSENGSLNFNHIDDVARQIGAYIGGLQSFHVVNVRSTVLPGTVEGRIVPLLEAQSGKKAGVDFGVCMNPEFMREGSSVHDFFNPPFTLIGELNERSGAGVAALYEGVKAPLHKTQIKVAEMLKYASNSFHAVKVTFANEIGNICKSLGVDSHDVMRLVCLDTKLNISPYYMKPGFAFGGSCLPKDLRALTYKARQLDVDIPLLTSIMPSNRNQIEVVYKMIVKTQKKKVGVVGLSFKSGTDDLRDSPMVELVELLIGKGYDIKVYDEEVSLARLVGSNKQHIQTVIPHITTLMEGSLERVVADSEVVVIAKSLGPVEDSLRELLSKTAVIDLVRLGKPSGSNGAYQGICW